MWWGKYDSVAVPSVLNAPRVEEIVKKIKKRLTGGVEVARVFDPKPTVVRATGSVGIAGRLIFLSVQTLAVL